MFRVRITRFRDRASYKSSEVIALFIISVFIGMVFCALCWLVEFVSTRLFHTG